MIRNIPKKNYPLYTRVKAVNCSTMTGKTGTIIGKSIVDIEDHYIVLLDENEFLADGTEVAAFTVTEHCLEEIHDEVVTGVWTN